MFSTHPPHPRQLCLSAGELLTLTPTRPTTLHLKSGALWVTQTGDDRDHFLRAGQTMQLAPHRLTVLQAESASVQASLAPAAKQRVMRRPRKGALKYWGIGLRFNT